MSTTTSHSKALRHDPANDRYAVILDGQVLGHVFYEDKDQGGYTVRVPSLESIKRDAQAIVDHHIARETERAVREMTLLDPGNLRYQRRVLRDALSCMRAETDISEEACEVLLATYDELCVKVVA